MARMTRAHRILFGWYSVVVVVDVEDGFVDDFHMNARDAMMNGG